jgi:hypothetical protein
MASFIYIYSKFTEELLLLGGAIVFALLSAYCYYWVIRKRRLGAARNEIPATVVKAYLGQLINEAQFVRTQLFGIAQANADLQSGSGPHSFDGPAANIASVTAAFDSGTIPGDLSDRLKALQSQLAEKESLVVNINVEKTKLLEEVENLRQNQKAIQGAAAAGGNTEDLLRQIKTLQDRLEEYSLFEEDLANLKRLQQENSNLKKRIEEIAVNPPPAKTEPSITPEPPPASALNQAAIDALLDGTSPIPPTEAKVEPSIDAVPTTAPSADEFEKLIDSVGMSLGTEPAPEAAPTQSASPAAPETLATKSDEELLKEFENLLNS